MKVKILVLCSLFIFSNLLICLEKQSYAGSSNGNDIVVDINGQKITRQVFGDFLIKAYGDVALDYIVKKKVVDQEAKKHNVKITDKEFEERLELAANTQILGMMRKNKIPSKEDLELQLFKQGMTLDKYRKTIIQSIKNQTEIEFKVEKILLNDITFTEEELIEAYKTIFGEKVRTKQIVLKTRKKADEVLRKLKGGAEFSKIAKKESIDRASAARGGEMMPLSVEGKLGSAVASLEPGQISQIIETGYGYHILLVLEKIAGSDKPFEEVIDMLENVVTREKLNQKVKPWIRELFEKSTVEILL